jgi:hypothetical protein
VFLSPLTEIYRFSGPFAFRVGNAKAMINAAVIAMKVLFQIAEFERIIPA